VAKEPLKEAAQDILATAKEAQKLYVFCSMKQSAEANWIGEQ
jgi:hypothetical protein